MHTQLRSTLETNDRRPARLVAGLLSQRERLVVRMGDPDDGPLESRAGKLEMDLATFVGDAANRQSLEPLPVEVGPGALGSDPLRVETAPHDSSADDGALVCIHDAQVQRTRSVRARLRVLRLVQLRPLVAGIGDVVARDGGLGSRPRSFRGSSGEKQS
ncbi:MAG: hypothetical protein IPJ77_11135 [Planctomycetes bacterium]|nr:hypothetical protein [Planctomycetota bacterium]